MNRLTKFFCILISSLLMWGCSESKSDEKQTIGVPNTIVNVRTGPGTNYDIVKGITPDDTALILSGQGEEWLYVSVNNGKFEGYVAAQYLDLFETTADEASTYSTSSTASSNNFAASPKFRIDKPSYDILAAWPMFVLNTKNAGFVTVLIILGIAIGLCVWLKKRYDYRQNTRYEAKPTGIGYLVIFISMILTIFQIVCIFHVRDGGSDRDFAFALMILSTGIPMATIPWRIRLSGLINVRDRAYSSRVEWGEKLGVIGWVILLFPLSVFHLQSASYQNLDMGDDTFSGMLFTLGAYALVSWAFVRFFWPYVVVKHLFKSMNSKVLCILNIVLALGIALYGYRMCDQTFTGLTFIVSLWLLVLISMVILMVPINIINEKRCGNCHNFDGQYEGSTDMGSTFKTDLDWKNASASSINPKHSGAYVSDARRLVRTTTRVDKWKTHHSCPYCYEQWDLDHEDRTEVGSETIKKKWKETY